MLKPAVRSVCMVLWLAFWYGPIWLAKYFNKTKEYEHMLLLCHRGMLFIAGIKLHVRGEVSDKRPLLMVSNHISYLDVILLGSQTRVRFTPKSDIAKWPVIGNICRLCDAVFIDRSASRISSMTGNLHKALMEGKVISLFPEATTGDGIHMIAFKSGFFSLAEGDFGEEGLTIQPVALTYTRIRKLPIDRTQWPDIAWYGDMELLSHVYHLFSLSPVEAELVFLPPIHVTKTDTRKELAAECQRRIEGAIEEIRARKPLSAKTLPAPVQAEALEMVNK